MQDSTVDKWGFSLLNPRFVFMIGGDLLHQQERSLKVYLGQYHFLFNLVLVMAGCLLNVPLDGTKQEVTCMQPCVTIDEIVHQTCTLFCTHLMTMSQPACLALPAQDDRGHRLPRRRRPPLPQRGGRGTLWRRGTVRIRHLGGEGLHHRGHVIQ